MADISASETARAELTAAEANSNLILAGYEAFSRGDLHAVFTRFADDILWHVPGRGPLSGDWRGHAELLQFFQRFMALSGGTFRITIDDVFARGNQVVVLSTQSAERGGRRWSSPQVEVWTVKDGRASTYRQYQGDQQAEDEFWSMPV